MVEGLAEPMIEPPAVKGDQAQLAPRLVDALYSEALMLAAEARAYFDGAGRLERDSLPPPARVAFACESLRVTTRIMHIVAWLLTARAARSLGLDRLVERSACRLGKAASSDEAVICQMPAEARRLIVASSELYERVKRVEQLPLAQGPQPSPARALMGRLERDFAASHA